MQMQRQLILMRVEKDEVPDEPGKGTFLNLLPLSEYGHEWNIVSHDLTIGLDGAGIVSILLETPVGAAPTL